MGCSAAQEMEMNHSDIEHMAQGFPPSSIGKDHEKVVVFLAKSLLTAQQKLDVAIKRRALTKPHCLDMEL